MLTTNSSYRHTGIILLAVIVTMTLASLWSYRGILQSIHANRSTELKALLQTQVEALEQWIDAQRREAAQRAADPKMRTLIETLIQIGKTSTDPLAPCRTPEHQQLLERAKVLSSEGTLAIHVIDRSGYTLVAPLHCGQRIRPAIFEHFDPVFRGDTIFMHPYKELERVINTDSTSANRLLSWIETPIRNHSGQVVAALGIGLPIDARFNEILKAGQLGHTGEAYTFDADGVMLSQSRYKPSAQKSGSTLLASPILLREPAVTDDPYSIAPYTALVYAALSARRTGGHGMLLEPYLNYRGQETIGAWRWMPQYDMGIAIEQAASEAYSALSYIQAVFFMLLGLATLTVLTLYVSPSQLMHVFSSGSRVKQLGHYHILNRLGEGAVCTVYLARHQILKRLAAVKVLKPQSTTDEWIARFEREVRMASQLHHPNTVTTYECGRTSDGLLYYAMEYLEGLTLQDLVEHYGTLSTARAAYLLQQVCASLAEAHGKQIVHRDIKPQNIMVCQVDDKRDIIKVLDFGLVKNIGSDQTRDLTHALRILGTPAYMSPERIRSPSDADARADIYALGAVGFFLLTGKKLFETETDHDLTYHILHTPAPRVSHTGVHIPQAMDDLLESCVRKSREERPQSISEISTALGVILEQHPWTERQIHTWWNRYWIGPEDRERRIGLDT